MTKDHVNLNETFTYLAEAVRELGHISLENTACNVSHSMKAKLWVFTIPGRKIRALGRSKAGSCSQFEFDPRHEKTGYLPMRKQRRRSVVQ